MNRTRRNLAEKRADYDSLKRESSRLQQIVAQALAQNWPILSSVCRRERMELRQSQLNKALHDAQEALNKDEASLQERLLAAQTRLKQRKCMLELDGEQLLQRKMAHARKLRSAAVVLRAENAALQRRLQDRQALLLRELRAMFPVQRRGEEVQVLNLKLPARCELTGPGAPPVEVVRAVLTYSGRLLYLLARYLQVALPHPLQSGPTLRRGLELAPGIPLQPPRFEAALQALHEDAQVLSRALGLEPDPAAPATFSTLLRCLCDLLEAPAARRVDTARSPVAATASPAGGTPYLELQQPSAPSPLG